MHARLASALTWGMDAFVQQVILESSATKNVPKIPGAKTVKRFVSASMEGNAMRQVESVTAHPGLMAIHVNMDAMLASGAMIVTKDARAQGDNVI